jgi:MOSC domain-containing protein YiiM
VPRGVASVNVSSGRDVWYEGRLVRTGIFKKPVHGPVRVGLINLDGDAQADRRHHGGIYKAVYAYPFEHYYFWADYVESVTAFGHFGENLTLVGLLEENVRIGQKLQVGTAVLEVSQPRIPCFKLGLRIGRRDFPELFLRSRRVGFYLRVIREGFIEAGDTVETIYFPREGITVDEAIACYLEPGDRRESALRLLRDPALAPEFRRALERRLARTGQKPEL